MTEENHEQTNAEKSGLPEAWARATEEAPHDPEPVPPIAPIEPVRSEHPIQPDTETIPIIINCYLAPSEDDPQDVSISTALDVASMADLPDDERAACLATAAACLNHAMISMVAHGRVSQEVMGHLVMQAMGAEPVAK